MSVKITAQRISRLDFGGIGYSASSAGVVHGYAGDGQRTEGREGM
jgi:hypothetical protein